jgi:hypothetical protein
MDGQSKRLGTVLSLIPLASYNDVWELEHRSLVTALDVHANRSEAIMAPCFVARKVSDENQHRMFAQK